MLLLDEPSASLDPRQRERLWAFLGRAGRRRSCSRPTTSARPSATPTALLVLADGELLFTGTPGELETATGGTRRRPTSRPRSSRSCTGPRPLMRWLLLKDLQILRRSPLLVALLVIYPVVIARAVRARALGRARQAEGRVREPRPVRRQPVQGRRPHARRHRLRRRAVRARSTRSASTPARRRSRRSAPARRSARW